MVSRSACGPVLVDSRRCTDGIPALRTKLRGEAPKLKRQKDLRAEPSQTLSNVQKRPREVDHDTDEGATGPKRFKSAGNSSGNKSARESAPREDSNRISYLVPTTTPQLSAPLQCGLYGIELMRSRWDRTHAVVILLEGELSVIIKSLMKRSSALWQTKDFPSVGMIRKDASEPQKSTSWLSCHCWSP